LDDEDPVFRALALETISYLGNRANVLMPSVAARIRDPVPKVRSVAIFALACMRPETKTIVPDLLLVVDPDRRFHTWSGYELLLAVEMLSHLGPQAVESAPALIKLLNEKSGFQGGPVPQESWKLAVSRALNQVTSGQNVQGVTEYRD
jgi:hypothetical protein